MSTQTYSPNQQTLSAGRRPVPVPDLGRDHRRGSGGGHRCAGADPGPFAFQPDRGHDRYADPDVCSGQPRHSGNNQMAG
jgi:hypothetical protein